MIHGTTLRRRSAIAFAPIAMCWPPGSKLGRRVEPASDHDQIPVDGGAGLHGHVPADDDERSVDDGRRANLDGAEDDDDVAAHVAVDESPG